MANGPEGLRLVQPLEAEAYPSTPEDLSELDFNYRHLEAATSFITPEGCDILTVEGAKSYIYEVHAIPYRRIRSFGDVMEALKHEPRAAVYKDGRQQSVYEHTVELVQICLEDIKKRPDLNKKLAVTEVWGHDGPESIGKDTDITDPVAMSTKLPRELASMTLLDYWLPPNDPYLRALHQYHRGGPEAIYVNSQDKNEPANFQLRDDVQAQLHKDRNEDFIDVLQMTLPKLIKDRSAFVRGVKSWMRLGEMWLPWGCKPFEGDPKEIVLTEAYDVMVNQAASQPKLSRLALGHLVPSIGPAISATELEERGVAVLGRKRHELDPNTPPGGGAGKAALRAAIEYAA